MKTTTITLSAILLLIGISVSAQDTKDTTNQYVVVQHGSGPEIKTLFGGTHTNGFYLSYDLGFGNFDNYQTVETGGRLAWIIDHSVALGLYGNGFVSASDFDKMIDNKNTSITLAGGYGGFFVEPIILPKKPIHISIPLMVGVGGATYDTFGIDEDSFDHFGNGHADAFMVLKAGAELELNMLRFFRIGLGASYRYVYGLNLEGFGKNDLNGITGTIALKFGKF